MTAAARNDYSGTYPATICPFRPDYSVDERAFEAHVAGVTQVEGIVGILCNGHAGENYRLSRAEKRRNIEIARQAMGRRGILVAGINSEYSLEGAEEARDAKAAGADALMVFPPFSWALAQDASVAVNHHTIIGAATDLPMMLFQNYVSAGKQAYAPEVLRALVRLPNIVAIKESSGETGAYEANLRMIREEAPHVAVMASGDEHLLACFVLGSEGSIVSLADVIPETIVRMYEAVAGGDLAGARAANDIVYPLAKAIYGAPPGGHATARVKTCLKLLGRLESDVVRPPIKPLEKSEVADLRRALQAVRLLS